MKYPWISFLFFLAAIVAFSLKAQSQSANYKVVDKLNEHIVPIQSFSPDSSFSDISFLKERLAEKDIVGLGEGTHGTREFFLYKDRLIRFMVTELHFKAIAFESDFASVMSLDDYINGKQERLKSLGGFPLFNETRAMLEWLRAYNSNKSEKEKVHIYGLEARGFENITKLLLDSIDNIALPMETLLRKVSTSAYGSLTRKDIIVLDSLIPSLRVLATQESRHNTNLQYVRMLEQEVSRYLQIQKNVPGMRDQNMFENTGWIQKQTINNKLIIWAHNGHISKSNIFHQDPMGKLLNKKHGDKYYAIATDMNHGEVGIFVERNKKYKYENVHYPPVSSDRGYEYHFARCKFSSFLLDVNKASNDSLLATYLRKPREMRMIGGTEKPSDIKLSLAKCFDLVAFFNTTSAVGSR